jgi:hypothetical protein
MMFLSRTQLIAALGAVALALYVLDLVRRRRLSEEYSLLWVIATTTIALLGFCTPLLLWVTRMLGILGGAASTVFAFGLGFALLMLLYLSVKMSRIAQQNHLLTQELALMRHDLERHGRPGAGA